MKLSENPTLAALRFADQHVLFFGQRELLDADLETKRLMIDKRSTDFSLGELYRDMEEEAAKPTLVCIEPSAAGVELKEKDAAQIAKSYFERNEDRRSAIVFNLFEEPWLVPVSSTVITPHVFADEQEVLEMIKPIAKALEFNSIEISCK